MGWGQQAEEKAEDWSTESEPDTMNSSQMVQKNQHKEELGQWRLWEVSFPRMQIFTLFPMVWVVWIQSLET